MRGVIVPVSEGSTMPFQGVLGGKFGNWLLEQCAAPPAQPHTPAHQSAGTCVDDTPRLSSLFGERFTLAVKGCMVLDYGCGYGETVVSLAKSDVGTAIGLDIRESVLEAARMLARQEEVGERCLSAVVASLWIPFDVHGCAAVEPCDLQRGDDFSSTCSISFGWGETI